MQILKKIKEWTTGNNESQSGESKWAVTYMNGMKETFKSFIHPLSIRFKNDKIEQEFTKYVCQCYLWRIRAAMLIVIFGCLTIVLQKDPEGIYVYNHHNYTYYQQFVFFAMFGIILENVFKLASAICAIIVLFILYLLSLLQCFLWYVGRLYIAQCGVLMCVILTKHCAYHDFSNGVFMLVYAMALYGIQSLVFVRYRGFLILVKLSLFIHI